MNTVYYSVTNHLIIRCSNLKIYFEFVKLHLTNSINYLSIKY